MFNTLYFSFDGFIRCLAFGSRVIKFVSNVNSICGALRYEILRYRSRVTPRPPVVVFFSGALIGENRARRAAAFFSLDLTSTMSNHNLALNQSQSFALTNQKHTYAERLLSCSPVQKGLRISSLINLPI